MSDQLPTPLAEPSLTIVAEPLAPVEVIDYRPSVRETLREAWHSRHLARAFTRGVIKGSFSQMILGPTWLIFPIFMTTIGQTLIFGKILKVPTPHGIPYFLFVLVGASTWRAFQRTLYLSLRGFRRTQRMTRTFHFPLLFAPIGGSALALLDLALFLIIFVISIGYFALRSGKMYLNLGPSFLLAPLGLFLALAFAWGISFCLAAIFMQARDVRFLLRYLLPFGMYVTPVIYPLDTLHGTMRQIAQVNPLAPIVEMVKSGLINAGSVSTLGVAYAIVATALTVSFGTWFLNRFGPTLVGTRSGIPDDDDEEELL